jgi:hypothetical protein
MLSRRPRTNAGEGGVCWKRANDSSNNLLTLDLPFELNRTPTQLATLLRARAYASFTRKFRQPRLFFGALRSIAPSLDVSTANG